MNYQSTFFQEQFITALNIPPTLTDPSLHMVNSHVPSIAMVTSHYPSTPIGTPHDPSTPMVTPHDPSTPMVTSHDPNTPIVTAYGGTIFKCHVCGKVFDQKYKLELHFMATCGKLKKAKVSKTENNGPLSPSVPSSNVSQDFGELKKPNNKLQESDKIFKCEICIKTFKKEITLKNHISSVHEGVNPHKCDICGKSFKFSHYLKRHISSVHEGKNLKCNICARTFCLEENLKKHIENHENTNQKCDSCDKIFSTAGKLKKHIKTVHSYQTFSENLTKTLSSETRTSEIKNFVVKNENIKNDTSEDVENLKNDIGTSA